MWHNIFKVENKLAQHENILKLMYFTLKFYELIKYFF